jgi:Na+(H+)/acetate symporter ActP
MIEVTVSERAVQLSDSDAELLALSLLLMVGHAAIPVVVGSSFTVRRVPVEHG